MTTSRPGTVAPTPARSFGRERLSDLRGLARQTSMAEKLVEQHVTGFVYCTAFGRRRAHKVRRGWRSGELAVFCTTTGTFRLDQGLSPEDHARITYYFTEGCWKRPQEGYYHWDRVPDRK